MHLRRPSLLFSLGLITLAAIGLAAAAHASDQAHIAILSPKDHEHLEADETYQLAYQVDPGPGGDHFHVWVDDVRGPGIHDHEGRYTLPKMTKGEHVITLKVVDKGHVPTGPQQTIHVHVD